MRIVAGSAAIVEGEPGIFPAPIAGGLVRLNRWVRRRLGTQEAPADNAEPGAPPGPRAPGAPPGSTN